MLAAPMHRHSREDEYSFVLAGTLGVIEEGIEVTAGPGDLVAKPLGRWHTFWNAGEDELRFLEIIVPGGSNHCSVDLPSLAASTPRKPFPPSRPSTAPRWTSMQPCRWSSATVWCSSGGTALNTSPALPER